MQTKHQRTTSLPAAASDHFRAASRKYICCQDKPLWHARCAPDMALIWHRSEAGPMRISQPVPVPTFGSATKPSSCSFIGLADPLCAPQRIGSDSYPALVDEN